MFVAILSFSSYFGEKKNDGPKWNPTSLFSSLPIFSPTKWEEIPFSSFPSSPLSPPTKHNIKLSLTSYI